MLRKVVGHKVWLRPIERVDREKRYRLDKGDVVIPGEALIQFTDGCVRRPVETRDEGEFGCGFGTHGPNRSTGKRPEMGNTLVEERTVTKLIGE